MPPGDVTPIAPPTDPATKPPRPALNPTLGAVVPLRQEAPAPAVAPDPTPPAVPVELPKPKRADPYGPKCGDKRPKVGDPVWFIMTAPGGLLEALPAQLYAFNEFTEKWSLNVFRNGTLWHANTADFCGRAWVNGGWVLAGDC